MKETFKINDKELKKLLEVFVKFDSLDNCKQFMIDLCTPSELQSLSDRWLVAKLISQGVSYRRIAEKTNISTATITRVGRTLKYGQGGYEKFLKKEK